MTIEQTVDIPASRKINIHVPPEVPVGRARIVFFPEPAAEYPADFPEGLKGKVSPKLYGKGEIKGDIIGPFFEEWESR
jgi:hypothetical protein